MNMIKKRLANQITLINTISIMVVFLIIGFSTFSFIDRQLVDRLTVETLAKTESAAKDINNIFENSKIVNNQTAINNDIYKFLKTTNTHDGISKNPYFQPVIDTLIRIKATDPNHAFIWIANESANFYTDNTAIIPDESYDVKARPWYPVAMAAITPQFTHPYVEWQSKQIVMSCVNAIREQNEVIGFVGVDISLDNIPEILNSYNITEGDIKFLVTDRGDFIYHPDSTKIMTSTIEDQAELLYPFRSQIYEVNNEFLNVKINQKDYYMISYPVANQGWVIVTLIDQELATNGIRAFKLKLTAVFTIIMLIFMVYIYLVTSAKMKPIGVLAEYSKQISEKVFLQNISATYLDRQDEMGIMARSFQSIINVFRNENEGLEERIKEKNTELEKQYMHIIESERMTSLGNLVAGVAHEINTPLGIGLSAASYLSKVNRESREKLVNGNMTKSDLMNFMSEIDESSELLNTNLERAAELIKNFKNVAVNQSSEVKETFNVKEVFESVTISLKHAYKKQNHKIIINCPEHMSLYSYPGALIQVLTNLIMNSIIHGFDQRPFGIMNLSCEKKEDGIVIVYKDNGKGISSEIIDQVFEPFFTTNRSQGNSGLGMHIVYNIVHQKLLGEIVCVDTQGEGAEFVIKIPQLMPQ